MRFPAPVYQGGDGHARIQVSTLYGTVILAMFAVFFIPL